MLLQYVVTYLSMMLALDRFWVITVVLNVVRVMIAMYREYGNWGYRSSLTPEPVELKLCMGDIVAHMTPHAQRSN